MVLEAIAKAVAGKLATEFIKKLGEKLKNPPIKKAFEEAICSFAQGYSFEGAENEGILRDFFNRSSVRKRLINFTGFFDEKLDVELLKREFTEAGFVAEQMPGFNFEQGMLRFVQTFEEISKQNAELQPFLQTKILEKIWEILKPKIINHNKAEREYLKQISLQNKRVDSRGIAQMRNIVELELDEIFVPLKAKKEVPIADTRRREQLERESEEIEKRTKEREIVREERVVREEPPVRIDDILKMDKSFVILGDPGSGKTTILKHLAYKTATGDLPDEITDGRKLLPILLPIRFYSAAVAKGVCRGLRNYLPSFLKENECPLENSVLESKLEAGECLLLFDGLDEVFDTHERHEVVTDLGNFLNRYSNNRIILTSRISGYHAAPMVGAFPHYTLEDFGPEDIEQFVRKWCWAMESIDKKEGASKKKAEETAQDLIEAIKIKDRVLKLASNPLMCTIIGLIHHQGQKLPNRRIELYNICADTFIWSWEELKRKRAETHYEFDERDVRTILEQVALWMHRNTEDNLIEIPALEQQVIEFLQENLGTTKPEAKRQANAFLELVRDRTGILLEKGQKLFGFMHLTFQEYFAACALTEEREKFIEGIGDYLRKPHWKEVILLAAARLADYSKKDSTKLVKAVREAPDEYEPYLHRNLLFAGQCLADDVIVDIGLQKEVLEQLSNLFTRTAVDALRKRIASVLGSMGKTRSQDHSLQTLLAGLSNKESSVRTSALGALGSLGVKEKEVVDKIIDKLGDKEWDVRDSAVSALGSLGVKEKEVVDKIIDKLRVVDEDVRASALGALGILGVKDKEVVEKIISKLGDEDEIVRVSALVALGSLGVKDKEVVDKIIAMLRDDDYFVRDSAVSALDSLGVKDKEVVDRIIAILGDEDRSVCASALDALGSLGVRDKEVVDKIIAKLGNEDRDVRASALDALGSLGVKDKEVVDKIIAKLGDEDAFVRISALDALGSLRVKDKEVVDKIISKLGDEDKYVRASALGILVSLGVKDKEVVERIIAKLGDEEGFVRDTAVRALGSLGVKDKEVVERIIAMLGDEYRDVRASALGTLGSLGVKDKEVVDKIIAKLGDKDENMRASAVIALGSLVIKDKEVVDKIIAKLGDEDDAVRDSAYEALDKLTTE